MTITDHIREAVMNMTTLTAEERDRLAAATGNAYLCPRCRVVVEVGHYPFCPHGVPAAHTRMPDVTWPGGKTFEHGFATPQTFYSPAEYHRALAANGFKIRGDGEEGRWATISPKALEDAKDLVSRCR